MEAPKVGSKSELLMRNAAAAFWENHFHTPFPCPDRRPSLPTITEKILEDLTTNESTGSPMNALVSSPKWQIDLKSPKGYKSSKNGALTAASDANKGTDSTSGNPERKIKEITQGSMLSSEASLSLKEPLRLQATSRALSEPLKGPVSSNQPTFDSIKHKRAQNRLEQMQNLASIPQSVPKCKSDDEVTQQRAIDAIHRADIIHNRRTGSLDEFDELKYGRALCLGESNSGKSEVGTRGSGSRSNSFKGSRPATRSSTPLSGRFNTLAEQEAMSLQDIIDKSPALQDAIAANLLLPSFARNTISSLIQSTRASDGALHSSMITMERSQLGGFRKI